jgi:hypothetical protein
VHDTDELVMVVEGRPRIPIAPAISADDAGTGSTAWAAPTLSASARSSGCEVSQ